MLKWRDVSVTLGGRVILDRISADVRRGEITVLLGKNGSGKSTLLQCLTTATRCTGEVLLDGRPLKAIPPKERAALLALQPQILPQPALTVRELVSLGRTPYTGSMGILSKADREIIRVAMETAEIADFEKRPVATLSGGERQRVFLAMMLAQQSACMLLDEPTSFLDASARKEFFSLCKRLKSSGKTLLMTMHDINEALSAADSLLILDGGRLVFSGTKEELLGTDLIERIYGVTRHTTVDGLTVFL